VIHDVRVETEGRPWRDVKWINLHSQGARYRWCLEDIEVRGEGKVGQEDFRLQMAIAIMELVGMNQFDGVDEDEWGGVDVETKRVWTELVVDEDRASGGL
jgi:uncharacterized protein (UPF0262 family)